MHPVREETIDEEDFEFTLEFKRRLTKF